MQILIDFGTVISPLFYDMKSIHINLKKKKDTQNTNNEPIQNTKELDLSYIPLKP